MAGRRLIQGLTSPWSVGFSSFGLAYGLYHVWDSTQSGVKYDLEEDLSGKTYIVTGATSGIGQVTAEELAKRNARVIMACRNREKCVQVRRDIVLNTRNKQVYCRQCDLEDFDSVRTFVQKLSKGKFELDRIDGLVHNAAMMQDERRVNNVGIEKTLATNHLGSFLLTGLLLDKLLAQDHPVRIVFLNTNIIDRKCDIDFADLNAEKEVKFDGFEQYKKSKLAAALFARELSEKLKDTNISVMVADPGRTKSNLTAQMDGQTFFLSRWLLRIVSFGMGERRVEKAVRPVLYTIADPDAENVAGQFIDRERAAQPWNEVVEDTEKRQRLWATSEVWTRLGSHMKQTHARENGPCTQEGPQLIPDAMDRCAADKRLCAHCHASIGEEAVVAMNRLFHPDHFICTACKRPIKQTYQTADNHAYCVNCFAHKYNPKCAGCLETLVDSCLLAMDRHWHPRCFTCSMCNRPLPNGEYYLVDDKPYDLDCHWAKRLEKREHMERAAGTQQF